MGRRRPQRPDPRRFAVRAPARRRALLRRPGGAREGDRRCDRDREGDRPPAADRGEGRPDGGRAGLLRQRLHAGARGGRPVGRVPRRARAGRSRPPVRRVVRIADARIVAGAVRAGRHRGAGLRDAGHRPARRRACPRSSATASTASSATTRPSSAYQVARVEALDRAAIRASVLDRFSAGRMTDGYEEIYRDDDRARPAAPGRATDGRRRRDDEARRRAAAAQAGHVRPDGSGRAS